MRASYHKPKNRIFIGTAYYLLIKLFFLKETHLQQVWIYYFNPFNFLYKLYLLSEGCCSQTTLRFTRLWTIVENEIFWGIFLMGEFSKFKIQIWVQDQNAWNSIESSWACLSIIVFYITVSRVLNQREFIAKQFQF